MKPSNGECDIGSNGRFQFTIRGLLFATLLFAVAISFIRTFGVPIGAGAFGLLGAAAGYCLTAALNRRRTYDVVVSYFLGAMAGAIAVDRQWGSGLEDPSFPVWKALPGLVLTAIGLAALSAWRFRSLGWLRDSETSWAAAGATVLRLARMFRFRREFFVLGTMLIALLGLDFASDRAPRAFSLVVAAAELTTSAFVLVSFAAICYYIFRIGLAESGLPYAIGHTLVCLALTVVGVVLGAVLVPLLIQGDIERWRHAQDDGSDAPPKSSADGVLEKDGKP
jgi:hypothetical protein